MRLRNRRQGYDRASKREYSYNCPSAPEYYWQWFWDPCFQAIVLAHFDIEQAKAELRILLAAQRPDGFIPHVVYWGARGPKRMFTDIGSYARCMFGLQPRGSVLIQPPVLAQAVRRVGEASKAKPSSETRWGRSAGTTFGLPRRVIRTAKR